MLEPLTFLNKFSFMFSESALEPTSRISRQWWLNGKIKLKLSQIYKAKGSFEAFVDVIFPVIRETLFLETYQQKVQYYTHTHTHTLFVCVRVLHMLMPKRDIIIYSDIRWH